MAIRFIDTEIRITNSTKIKIKTVQSWLPQKFVLNTVLTTVIKAEKIVPLLKLKMNTAIILIFL
jgi:hypothetical protein